MKIVLTFVLGFSVLVLSSCETRADSLDIPEIQYITQGGILPDTTDYVWWYGCSATAAGMLIGHYDRNGYNGFAYDNLVPGGLAEQFTYVSGGAPYSPPTDWDATGDNAVPLANLAIASQDHVEAFYSGGYGAKGDDLPRDPDTFNCLADFMGTSQARLFDTTDPTSIVENSNGATSFAFYTNGHKMHWWDVMYRRLSDYDGMFGIGEYINDTGHTFSNLYNQAIDTYVDSVYPPEYFPNYEGFTFDDFKAEIDDGRPVILHVTGHSMYAYGYDDTNGSQTVYVHDTWRLGEHTMEWGGTYLVPPAGTFSSVPVTELSMVAVTVVELGDPIPPPASVIPEPASVAVWCVLGVLGLSLGSWRRRR